MIMLNKELQVQPNLILAVIAFAEFTEVFMYVIKDQMCSLRLPDLFAYTTKFENTYETEHESIVILTKSASMFSGFGFRLSVALNIGLCIDVVMTLRYPFTNRQKRM